MTANDIIQKKPYPKNEREWWIALEAQNAELEKLRVDNERLRVTLRRIADYSTDGEGAAAFARRELDTKP